MYCPHRRGWRWSSLDRWIWYMLKSKTLHSSDHTRWSIRQIIKLLDYCVVLFLCLQLRHYVILWSAPDFLLVFCKTSLILDIGCYMYYHWLNHFLSAQCVVMVYSLPMCMPLFNHHVHESNFCHSYQTIIIIIIMQNVYQWFKFIPR